MPIIPFAKPGSTFQAKAHRAGTSFMHSQNTCDVYGYAEEMVTEKVLE